MDLRRKRIIFGLLCLGMVCFIFSGCALLQVPLALVEAPLKLLGEVFKLVGKLPKPPPGVFF